MASPARAGWFEDGEGTPEIGCGHHGGLGPAETRPFLTFIHTAFGQRGEAGRPTSSVDIAPTILRFREAVGDMDGAPVGT